MKNAQSIYYLIGATIVVIVVNTVFFLLQSAKNGKSYERSQKTYETIETTHYLFDNLKDAESGLKGYLLTRDSTYIDAYLQAVERLRDTYFHLYSNLSIYPEQHKNLANLNHLMKIKSEKLASIMTWYRQGQQGLALDKVNDPSGRQVMNDITKLINKISKIEKERLIDNNASIEKLTKKTQIFSVISNWILLIIVISALISIVQNRETLSALFKEVENKNEILESQKTELQSLSQDLIKQNDELERFAYIASHDLRSPGVNLIALLQLYEEAVTEEEKEHLLDIIKEVADNLIVKLDDLIDMLRSKHESYAVHEELTFKQIYNNVVKNLSADIKKSNAILHYDFSEVPKLKYPKSYLESIFQNLLSNAIKYRHPDREPEISVRTLKKNDKILMEVRDNGLGIDLKKHGDSIFGIYQTFHENSKSKGVGLYITKAQVVAMGGNIEVRSAPGEGTVFIINFS
ncbi:sensor histidine kinase [Desertivirga xinjiangensis]|uniref:sensor histidine kinase n=1 Tax=Desertivirga xinjiangensis TaxID=539206 RepID=UPI002109AABF|nr:CHASE3 domain-containing protein [Pedobacter xinjiangensis]